MTPDRWQAIGELFDLALAVPANERTALIDRNSGTDEELRREVRSLLASHDAAPGGFVQKRIDVALESFHRTSTASAPARAGPYRLIRELGRGGMGAVFLAERDDEHHAKVAVKLVRPGMDTEFILARFRRERQTLARLQHPNISRLLDGGTADHGLPYIVMEYIDGPWITAYAAQRNLGVEARLRLFLPVCAAVDYAHRNFIVHRDLKPGNIPVDARGVPKLLDFGICKLLVENVTAGSDTVAAPLTPSYASPEQIRGEAVTVSSDIYSLGAVLYELLTGTSPRRFENLTPLAIERALEGPIVRPGAAVGDTRLARQLSGDLDNILLRALDAEPSRRYESAAQLAEDVRRHLEHEPVRARPHTVGYRVRTFVRRHRGSTAAVTAVVATLMVGIAVSLYEARLADARVSQVRSLASTLMSAYGHRADVLSNPDLQNPGEGPGALRAYRQAVDVGKRLYELDRSDQRAASDYGIALSHLETAIDDDDLPEKLAVQRESLLVLDEAGKINPHDVTILSYRALVRLHLGDTLTAAGKVEDARLAYMDSAAIVEPSLKLGHASLLLMFMRLDQRLALNAVAQARRADALAFAERALHTGESSSDPLVPARPRGSAAIGLTYAALLRSPVRQPGDREAALSWLRKAADAWHAAESESALTPSDRREMREIEEALNKIARW